MEKFSFIQEGVNIIENWILHVFENIKMHNIAPDVHVSNMDNGIKDTPVANGCEFDQLEDKLYQVMVDNLKS